MTESSAANNVEMRVQLMLPDIHTKEFQCPVCAKCFRRKFTLDAHMLIHKGEKPHACPFCGKCFRQKGTLMRHKALHSTKNLFHCSLCNRGFRQKNVFIHHLRHRHNVLVETLDRRKYRPGLKDIQSIMDTLPSFVHADSTAIISSEKHFDAVLFESAKNPDSGSLNGLPENDLTDKLQNSSTSNTVHMWPFKDGNEANGLCLVSKEYDTKQNHSNVIISQETVKDKNSCFGSNSDTVDNKYAVTQISSSTVAIENADNFVSSHCDNSFFQIESDDESLLCTTCHCSFTSKADFKTHIKSHLEANLNANSDKSREILEPPNIYSTRCKANCGVSSNAQECIPAMNSRSLNNEICKPDSIEQTEIQNPIKLEALDTKVTDSLLLAKARNTEFSIDNYTQCSLVENKILCPVCKIEFIDENDFKMHSSKHDSFSLLKIISLLSDYQNSENCQTLNPNAAEVKQINIPAGKKNLLRKSKGKISNLNVQLRKSVSKTSYLKKSFPKKLQCTQCCRKFRNELLFEYHRQLHLSIKGFCCRSCLRCFSTKRLLLSHTRAMHLKIFSCSKCSRNFSYKKLYESHLLKCKILADFETLKGSNIDFPVIKIESLLNYGTDGIIGVIPISDGSQTQGIQFGIPIMSVSQIKALYSKPNVA